MKIVNKPSISIDRCREWLKTKKECNEIVFELLDIIWDASLRNGINPCVLLAQALIETNYFNSEKHVNNHNTGSLKEPIYKYGMLLGYKGDFMFRGWRSGISAHSDHLALYAGVKGFPKHNPHSNTHDNEFTVNGLTSDPMHFHYLIGSCTNVEHLSGDWAETDDYGEQIVELVNEMIKYTKENKVKEKVSVDTDRLVKKHENLQEAYYKKEEECEEQYEEICKLKDIIIDLLNEISDLKRKINNK